MSIVHQLEPPCCGHEMSGSVSSTSSNSYHDDEEMMEDFPCGPLSIDSSSLLPDYSPQIVEPEYDPRNIHLGTMMEKAESQGPNSEDSVIINNACPKDMPDLFCYETLDDMFMTAAAPAFSPIDMEVDEEEFVSSMLD